MFLTQAEVEELTGYQLAAWQRRWLDRQGWIYTLTHNGRAVVSRSYAESRLSGVQSKREPSMNLAWLKKSA